MSARAICGRWVVRGRATVVVCALMTIGGADLLASSASAQDTGALPLPSELDLGKLPSVPGLSEALPNLGGLWTFNLIDHPGSWFDTGINVIGTKSLGVTTAPLANVS